MKSKKRLITIAVLALAGLTLIAVPAAARRGGMNRADRGMGRGMGPAFTQEQLEQIQKINDKHSDERAQLTNRLKVIMAEAMDVEDDAAPDFNAIEKNLEEVSAVRLQLAKLNLRIHKEIRPLLDDDQKVLFDRGLRGILHGGRGMGHPGMMGGGMRCNGMGPGMMGGGMRGGPGMRGGTPGQPGMGAGPGMGMGPGMGNQMAPWCPFADDDVDDE
jgi:Spy/CpxP family protein refolding chaperone